MVICGYLIEESKLNLLKDAKDSKLLSPKQRDELDKKLKKIAKDYALVFLSAEEIDRLREISNLNKIEIKEMQKMINLLKPQKVIIDSPENNVKKFEEKIRKGLKEKNIEIICENYADSRYPIVSAASILAKVARDKEIEKIKNKYNIDFGSGYPSDERTIKFLKDWLKTHKELPNFVRKSWITIEQIKNETKEKKQKTIKDYF
jgi:ribonuclease HII